MTVCIRGLEYMNDDPSSVDVLYAKVSLTDSSTRYIFCCFVSSHCEGSCYFAEVISVTASEMLQVHQCTNERLALRKCSLARSNTEKLGWLSKN